MKTNVNLLSAACCLLLILQVHAQNTSQLKNITAPALQQLMKEHKNIHFVTENGAKGPVLKYYEEPKRLTSAVSSSIQNIESARAANFHLTKDINAQTDANPVNSNFVSNRPYAVLNKIMYFSADDGIHGAELWRSDGTAAGTYLADDLVPGTVSSNPREIITVGSKLFFVTQNFSTSSFNLWTSDGTAGGTMQLKDVTTNGPGLGGSYNLTNVGGTVYFFINAPFTYYDQLWKTDGTVSGTVLVKDFGSATYAPFLYAAAQGLFYFTIFDNITGRELWRSDGTDSGTFLIKDISDSTDFLEGPTQLTAFNNKLYFSADDGSGRKLWLTNGTAAGTHVASNTGNVLLYPNYSDFYINEPFAVQENNLYMSASVPATGSELYKYNTASGFSLIKDITPGAAGGSVYNITPAFNYIAFEYFDTLNKTTALWGTDGFDKTGLLKASDGATTYFDNLTPANNLLYFISADATNGTELWKTAGTPASTVLVKDIYAGSTSSFPADLTNFNNKLYFNAASKKAGTELWQSDGSDANTNMVTEINKTTTNSSGPYFSPGFAYGTIPGSAIGNTYYFNATKPETGFELYKSDGTGAGTSLASDIILGENGSFPRSIITKNNAVYYMASGADSFGNYFYNIYKTDSTGITSAGIAQLNGYIENYAVADNGLVYYIRYNYISNQDELWRTDGTVAGSFMLTDKVSRANYPFAIKTIGNIAYFVGADENGDELWSSNGSIANTKIVKDINAGANSSSPYSLYVYKNNIFFGADDGTGVALWRSNGKASGTIKVKAILPYGANYSPNYNNYFCEVNNILYLNAYTPGTGNELWRTNGTSSGTVLVKDLTGDANSSNPAFLTNVNGSLFFSALNNQLWKTDGTAVNTVLIQTISSNDYYNIFSERCVADGKFFFNTNQLLWVSDGTNAGTHQVQDNGLNGVSLVTNLAAANNTVFFNGYTDKYSYELYAGDATKVMTPDVVVTKIQLQKQASFTAAVLQNPVTNKLNLQIKSDRNQTINIIVSNAYGNLIAQQKCIAGKGVTEVNINAGSWQTGVYTVKLYNNAADAISMQVLK